MKDKTPDEIHAALKGQVIRLDPHPANELVVCMRADAVVITALRSVPTAPQTWYSPTDTAYLVKAADVNRLTVGLRSFGAAVIGGSAPAELASVGSSRGPWCGRCDERTRLLEAPMLEGSLEGSLDHPTLTRCPECHPLRSEPLPGMSGRREALPAVELEEWQAGLAEVRAEMGRLGLLRRYRRAVPDDEPVLLGELLEADGGDDEAHPF